MTVGIVSYHARKRAILVSVLLGASSLGSVPAQAAKEPAAPPNGARSGPALRAESTGDASSTPVASEARKPAEASDAAGTSVTLQKKTTPKPAKKPWRGSSFTWGNGFTLYSLDRTADLTYNPMYYMSFAFQPRWWFGDKWYTRAILTVNRELTQADDTTYKNEAWLEDLLLVGGADKLFTIPKAKIDFSTGLSLILPTSKASQAASLILGIGIQAYLSREFKVLKGLSIGAQVRATPYIHRYTTRQLESPLVANCSPSNGGCGAFLNMGLRNPMLRLTTALDASLAILKWLAVSLEYGWLVDWLRPTSGGEDVVTYEPQEPQNQRYYSYFQAAVAFQATKALGITLAYLTLGPQLRPDSEYYNPLFNRYTTLSVNLTLKVDGFIALVGGK